MVAPIDRILTRISDAELERRWGTVRDVMKARGLDALIMQSTNDWVSGYAKWFTDIPATNGYPRTIIFYAAEPMTVVEMGSMGGTLDLKGKDLLHRGVGNNSPVAIFSFNLLYANL